MDPSIWDQKVPEPTAERELQATVFTVVTGKIDFHNFHFLTLSKQINSNFDLKSIYCPALV